MTKRRCGQRLRGNGGKSNLYSSRRSDFAAAIIAPAISRLLLNLNSSISVKSFYKASAD